MVGWAEEDEGIEDEGMSIADEVVNEKSREELKELLVKAGQIIRQRENGKYFGITSPIHRPTGFIAQNWVSPPPSARACTVTISR